MCKANVTSAKVIEDLHTHSDGHEEAGLFYFYVDESNQYAVNKEYLYRSLLRQLYSRKGRLPSFLEDLYSLYGPEGQLKHRAIPIRRLEVKLQRTLRDLDDVFIVLDGLDECDESGGYEEMVGFISLMLNLARNRIHIIAFSRDLERIRYSFEGFNATTITINGDSLGSDLQMALRHQLRSQRKLARWPTSLKKTVETSLLSQASGS